MKAAIFVVEDDPDIGRLIRHHLEAAQFGVRVYRDGATVLAEAEQARPQLFVLDVMLPRGDGFELCRRIRATPALAKTPVIFVTARTGEAEKLAGFTMGADDYITKPFSPREFVARVKAVLRRFEQQLPDRPIETPTLHIDPAAMVVKVNGAPVEMTATEFRLLHHLASNPGRVFTRDALLDAVWRDTAFVTPRSVDVYIRRLREKVEADPENPAYLRTIRGVGYKFEAGK